jgi:small-conductance mechanosensitive channel
MPWEALHWNWITANAAAWITVAVILGGAIAVALIVHAIVFAVLKRLAAKPGRVVEFSLYTHARRPLRWLLPLLALLFALPAAPLPALVRQGLEHLFGLGFIAGIAWSILLLVDIAADVLASRYRVDIADNLVARRIRTQVQVLRRVTAVVVIIVTLAVMLLTFPGARPIGASLLASAGLAGLVVGMAMRPTLANLVAGIQIALTQPIRLDDAVIVQGEYGWVEEITSTYVVVRIWDLRRMVLPLTYFIETPFQNWTRNSANLLGTVHLYADYAAPIDALRAELNRLVHATPLWKGEVCVLQVTHANEHTIELRALVDARNAGESWDLRCLVREGLIQFLQQHYPESLPRTRAEINAHAATPSAPA